MLEPVQDQIRVTAGWGQMNRKGWNTATSIAYDTIQHALQYEVVQASYNGGCCGISFEYRRLLSWGRFETTMNFGRRCSSRISERLATLTRQERLF